MKKIVKLINKYFINKAIVDVWFPSTKKKKKRDYFTKKKRKIYERRNVYR